MGAGLLVSLARARSAPLPEKTTGHRQPYQRQHHDAALTTHRRAGQWIGGGGVSYVWSLAEHDHHAFSFFAGRGVLAIPVSSWTWDEVTQTSSGWNALVVYEADPASGLTEIARIEHGSAVSRSLRIGGRLFSIGETELKVVDLDAPATVVASLPLA